MQWLKSRRVNNTQFYCCVRALHMKVNLQSQNIFKNYLQSFVCLICLYILIIYIYFNIIKYIYRKNIDLNTLDYSYKRYIVRCVLAKTDGWFNKDDPNNNEWQFGTWGWSHVDSIALSHLIYVRKTNSNGGNVTKEIIQQLFIHNKHVINKIWQWKRKYPNQLRQFDNLMKLKIWTIAHPWIQLADMEIKKNESRYIANVRFKIDPNEPYTPVNGSYSCRNCDTNTECKCVEFAEK